MTPLLSGLRQIAIPVRDLAISREFYVERLGLPLLFEVPGMAFLDIAGIRLMLAAHPGEVGPPASGICLYFRVTGIELACARLGEKGVHFEQQPFEVARMPDHRFWLAFFRDPDQHLLALAEEKPL